eukprot:385761-Prorocentrum_minimum.AAC.1
MTFDLRRKLHFAAAALLELNLAFVNGENVPALLAFDWSVVRTYLRFLRSMGQSPLPSTPSPLPSTPSPLA